MLDLKAIRAQDDEPLDDDELTPGRSASLLGRVVFVGSAGLDPRLLTLYSAHELSHADLVIAASQFHAALADVVELEIQPEAELVAIDELDADPERATELAVQRAVECCAAGKTCCWVLPGEPFVDGRVARLAKRFRSQNCRLEIYAAVDWSTAIGTLAGLDLAAAEADVPAQLSGGLPELAKFQDLSGADLTFVTKVDRLAGAAQTLLAAGISQDVPVRVVAKGGGVEQHSVVTSLAGLADVQLSEADEVLVVVGAAANPDPELNWWETKPLIGWQVLLPRTQGAPGPMEHRLQLHGAAYQVVPTMAIEPPRNTQAMERAVRGMVEGEFQWIVFTDLHAVNALIAELKGYGLDARSFAGLRVAATDPRAVEVLENFGIHPDLVSSTGTAAGLAQEFPIFDDLLDPLDGVLIPRASVATEELAAALSELGWRVEDVMFARAVRSAPPSADIRATIKSGGYDAVVFTSVSTVRNLVGIAGKPHPDTIVAAIGPKTAQACAQHDLRVDVVAETPGELELIDALALFAEQRANDLAAAGGPVYRPSQRPRRRRATTK